jgi:hypothetical protein
MIPTLTINSETKLLRFLNYETKVLDFKISLVRLNFKIVWEYPKY